MFGINRKKRPVELGPYPIETLRRDAQIAKEERSRSAEKLELKFENDTAPLVRATFNHLAAFKDLREPEPFSKKAPVPEDLALRTRDIKGAGYFLDSSQIGICEIPNNAWLLNSTPSHDFAILVLIEHSDPIDEDNRASSWVTGNEDLIATLRAAEIAVK